MPQNIIKDVIFCIPWTRCFIPHLIKIDCDSAQTGDTDS